MSKINLFQKLEKPNNSKEYLSEKGSTLEFLSQFAKVSFGRIGLKYIKNDIDFAKNLTKRGKNSFSLIKYD